MVNAPATITYDAIRNTDLAAAIPVKLLLAIRALPGAIGKGVRGLSKLRERASQRITLNDFEKTGFSILAENPPRELLIGVVGAFWKPGGGICATDAAQFRGPQPPGTARAVWNFSIEDVDKNRVRLATETRVQPADPGSARFFRVYWLIVRPGSALIRRYMLRAIRREAEVWAA